MLNIDRMTDGVCGVHHMEYDLVAAGRLGTLCLGVRLFLFPRKKEAGYERRCSFHRNHGLGRRPRHPYRRLFAGVPAQVPVLP